MLDLTPAGNDYLHSVDHFISFSNKVLLAKCNFGTLSVWLKMAIALLFNPSVFKRGPKPAMK